MRVEVNKEEKEYNFGQLAKYIIDNNTSLQKIDITELSKVNVDERDNRTKKDLVATIFDVSTEILEVENLQPNFIELIWSVKFSKEDILTKMNMYRSIYEKTRAKKKKKISLKHGLL